MINAIQLDVRGIEDNLFMPRVRKMLAKLYPGQTLEIVTSDEESEPRLANYCCKTGDNLISRYNKGEKIFFIIQKKPQI